jgi:hypothetical protein
MCNVRVENVKPPIYYDENALKGEISYRCGACGENGILVKEDHSLLMCILFLRRQIIDAKKTDI